MKLWLIRSQQVELIVAKLQSPVDIDTHNVWYSSSLTSIEMVGYESIPPNTHWELVNVGHAGNLQQDTLSRTNMYSGIKVQNIFLMSLNTLVTIMHLILMASISSASLFKYRMQKVKIVPFWYNSFIRCSYCGGIVWGWRVSLIHRYTEYSKLVQFMQLEPNIYTLSKS